MKNKNKNNKHQVLGGLKRAENLSPTRRSEIARRAAEARWQSTPRESKTVMKGLLKSAILSSGAPAWYESIAKVNIPFMDSSAVGPDGKRYQITSSAQEADYADPVKLGSLIVVGSMLSNDYLKQSAYNVFVNSLDTDFGKSSTSRWYYAEAYKDKPSVNHTLLIDGCHPGMDSRKFSVVQELLAMPSITKIIVVHGAEPLDYCLNYLKHAPDRIFHVGVRLKLNVRSI